MVFPKQVYICTMKVQCTYCNKDIIRSLSQIKRSKTGNVYCSRSCSNSSNNTLFKSGKNHPNYKTGISFYRKRKLEKGDKCEKCGNDNLCVLQVHHKDKNRNNNIEDNLQLLCANCHLTEHCLEVRVLSS